MNIEKNSSRADSCFVRGLSKAGLAKFLPWIVSAGLFSGCASHYDMTLTNGTRITNVTKPTYYKDEGAFYYKDVSGKVHHISSGRVVEINPHSRHNTTPGSVQ